MERVCLFRRSAGSTQVRLWLCMLQNGVAAYASILRQDRSSSLCSAHAKGGDEGPKDVQLHAVEAGMSCIQKTRLRISGFGHIDLKMGDKVRVEVFVWACLRWKSLKSVTSDS